MKKIELNILSVGLSVGFVNVKAYLPLLISIVVCFLNALS